MILPFTRLTSSALAALLWLSGCSRPAEPPPVLGKDQAEMARRLAVLDKALGKPRPGDWLAEHAEEYESFEQYVASKPNRPNRRRTTLYVQPIGEFTPAQEVLIERSAAFLALVYAVPVKRLAPVGYDALPAEAQRGKPGQSDHQLHTGQIMRRILKPRRPDDAVAVLGLTSVDLWPGEGWNFVFGEASLRERVGVWSLARYGDPANARTLLRTLKVACHETGHMFGLPHCIVSECGMNGSNSLEEADRGPLHFCAECERKVWWACQADPRKRNAALLAFAERHDLAAAAAHWRRVADALGR